MKNNISVPMGKNTAPNKQYPYDLSICMITKNDVTLLERCLSSMKPLREALNCQLIITDTGSNDGTRELAQQEADLFLDFTWCDDFAKARNVGLEKAQGRWMFYVDSDHEFDDSYQAIVDFMSSPEGQSNKHPYATLMIRNYQGRSSNNTLQSNDMISCLMVNFSQQKRFFVGRIHESIPLPSVEVPHIPAVLHHWGYTEGKNVQKSQRNGKILLEVLKENPFDFKQQLQYLRENLPPDVTRAHIPKVLEAIGNPKAKGTPDFPLWSMLCFICISDFYLKQQDYAQAETTIETLKQSVSQDNSFRNTILSLEVFGLSYGLSLGKQHSSLEKYENFQDYRTLFYQLKEQPNNKHVIFYDYPHTTEKLFYTLELALTKELLQDGHQTEALSLLQQSKAYRYKNHKEQYVNLKDTITIALKLEAFSQIQNIHQFLITNPTQSSGYLLEYALEDGLSLLSLEKQQDLFSQLGAKPQDAYTALCHFRSKNYQWQDCLDSLLPLLEKDKLEEPFLSALLYSYVKYQEDPLHCLEQLPQKMLPPLVKQLGEKHPDFFSLVLENLQSDTFAIHSLKEEQFWAQLGYEVLLQLTRGLEQGINSFEDYSKEITPCFKAVTELMKHYIDTVYNPNILSYEGISVLSLGEHFGFYCAIALESVTSDSLQYIRTLKEALNIAPKYQSLVYFLIAQLNNNHSPSPVANTPHNSEFSALAVEVKKNIELFIAGNQISTAKALLEKYRSIQPNDPELPSLLARCGM